MDMMTVHYYFRHQWFESVSRLATPAATTEPTAALFKAVSLVHCDHVSEALQVLSPFCQHPDASVSAIKASVYAHNNCQVVDNEAVSQLEEMLRDKLRNARQAMSFYLESLYHYLVKENIEGIAAIENSLKADTNSSMALALLGWLQLDLKKTRAAARHFSQALKDKDNSDAMMGEVYCVTPIDGLSRLNKLVVRHPKEIVPIMRKMELLLNTRQWDPLADTILRAAGIDSSNLAVLQIQALKHVIDGKFEESIPLLEKLHSEIDKQEPRAWWIYIEVVSLFSRLCCGSRTLYSCLERHAKSALRVCTVKESPKVLLEVGHMYYQWGKMLYNYGEMNTARERLRLAESTLRRAANSDESTRSLVFLVMVQLVTDNPVPKQVHDQLELLAGLGAEQENAEFLLAKVLVQSTDQDHFVELLDKAVSIQQGKCSTYKYGISYLISLDPQLLVNIAEAYPQTKLGQKHRLRVLTLVVETLPGLVDARLDLARVHLIIGQTEEALSVLDHIVSVVDQTNPHAYLLQAHIHTLQGDYEKGRSLLELGLSNNLQITELPQYHVIRGVLARVSGNDSLCINEMKQAIAITKGKNKLQPAEISLVFAELSGAYMRSNKIKEASEVIKEAGELLKGTKDEAYVTISKARLSLVTGDVRTALTLLSSIPKDNSCYVEAQKAKAEIYLNELKDGHGYSACYQTLVEADPSIDNLIMLADAYMDIQEPELSIQTYERALAMNTEDPRLSCKLARVFVKCHQYSKAIKAYKNSGEEGSIELAELLLKLGQPEKAEQALSSLPLSKSAITLAKVYEKKNDYTQAISMLREAVSLSSGSDSDWTSKLYRQMAVYSTQQKEYKQAIDLYKRALQYTPEDSSLRVALVKLYMQVDDWASCEETCKAVLSKDPQNEPALLTTADLSLRRVDLNAAMSHFSSILDRRPDHWVALARLIEVCRRCDKLDSALPYLEMAKEKTGGSHNPPGLSYCQGLYEWYKGDTQTAVASFNSARSDAEWGPQAVHNMIEMALVQNGGSGGGGATTAHRLLKELQPRGEDEETTIGLVEGFIRLASGEKSEVEKAILDFTSLANNDYLRVGASLGLAMGYMEQNQVARAKAVLKRIAKLPWSLEEADYLERCWLMLAEIYINNGVQQAAQAQDLLQRVITHNKSCIKAYTLLATLVSKENNYQKAGEYYRQAWHLSGEADPSLGYKLAYTQLKNKQYADAIATCQQVLQLHPDYPKIRKDILEKALPRLRS